MRHIYECELRTVDSASLPIVNVTAFADYLQEARIDLLDRLVSAEARATYELEEVSIDFVRPLRFEDGPVHIEVWVSSIEDSSVTLAYQIYGSDRQKESVFARASTVMVPCAEPHGLRRRLSRAERASLETYLLPEH